MGVLGGFMTECTFNDKDKQIIDLTLELEKAKSQIKILKQRIKYPVIQFYTTSEKYNTNIICELKILDETLRATDVIHSKFSNAYIDEKSFIKEHLLKTIGFEYLKRAAKYYKENPGNQVYEDYALKD